MEPLVDTRVKHNQGSGLVWNQGNQGCRVKQVKQVKQNQGSGLRRIMGSRTKVKDNQGCAPRDPLLDSKGSFGVHGGPQG